MKITSQQYAQALLESVFEKDKNVSKQTIKEFVRVLAINNDINKQNEIIKNFEELWQVREGVAKVDVKSARPLDETSKKQIMEFIKKNIAIKKINIKESIDKKLIGGVVVRYKDKIWDISTRCGLNRMHKELLK